MNSGLKKKLHFLRLLCRPVCLPCSTSHAQLMPTIHIDNVFKIPINQKPQDCHLFECNPTWHTFRAGVARTQRDLI